MELAIGILVVAVLGGLTMLAYRNQEAFRKITLPLYWITMTADLYGHLFPRGDDSEELEEAAASLLA